MIRFNIPKLKHARGCALWMWEDVRDHSEAASENLRIKEGMSGPPTSALDRSSWSITCVTYSQTWGPVVRLPFAFMKEIPESQNPINHADAPDQRARYRSMDLIQICSYAQHFASVCFSQYLQFWWIWCGNLPIWYEPLRENSERNSQPVKLSFDLLYNISLD